MKKLLMQHEQKMRSDTAGGEKEGVPLLSFKQLRVKPYTNRRSCLSMLSSVCNERLRCKFRQTETSAETQYSAPVTTGRQVCLTLEDLRISPDAT